MEPTARAPKPPTSPLRRYLPFIAGVVVIAIVVVAVNLAGGDDKKTGSSTTSTPAATTKGGPVTLTDANRSSIAWGPKCDVTRGTVAVPLTYAPPCVKPFSGDNGGATSRPRAKLRPESGGFARAIPRRLLRR